MSLCSNHHPSNYQMTLYRRDSQRAAFRDSSSLEAAFWCVYAPREARLFIPWPGCEVAGTSEPRDLDRKRDWDWGSRRTVFPTPPLPPEYCARAASRLRMMDLSYSICSVSDIDDSSPGRGRTTSRDGERMFPAPPRPIQMICFKEHLLRGNDGPVGYSPCRHKMVSEVLCPSLRKSHPDHRGYVRVRWKRRMGGCYQCHRYLTIAICEAW
jgi:hypothetical protein